MPDLTVTQLLVSAKDLGSIGCLVVAVWAIVTGKVVPGWLYQQEVQRNETLTTALLRVVRVTEKVLPP